MTVQVIICKKNMITRRNQSTLMGQLLISILM